MSPEYPGFDNNQIVVGIEAANLHGQRTKLNAWGTMRPVKKWPTVS
jgi:hypothetical protein